MPDINSLMMQGRAYQGMPLALGGSSFGNTSSPALNNAGVSNAIFSQPNGFGFGTGAPSLTDPLAFANGAGAFGVPYANGGFNNGFGNGFGNGGVFPQQGLGIPKQNTPTGYPPPVSGDKASDIMFSLFQGVGIALKIRTQLNVQERQQKELAAALQQQQMEALLNRGGNLQNQLHQQWDAQDRRYAEEERRLGKCRPSNAGNRLATLGENVANTMNTKGYCARGVQNTLEKAGYRLPRCTSAYQMAETLEKSGQFKTIPYAQRQPGDIVVFNRTSAKRHGHVAIQLADGKQACDFVGNDANPNKYGGVTVFRLIEESVSA